MREMIMKICFLNSNLRPTFVFGQVVYEAPCTGRMAQYMVNTCLEAQREYATDATCDAAKAIEFLIQHGATVGNLNELEHNGSPIIHVHNKAIHLNPRLKLNR